MAALLSGGPARGVSPGSVLKIAFQQAGLGIPLDDVVLTTRIAGMTSQVALQLKRSVRLTKADADFRAILYACWETFQKPEMTGFGNRFGLASSNLSEAARLHYARVPQWARTSGTAADFFERMIAGVSSNAMRQFVALVQETLSEIAKDSGTGPVSDEALWQFLRSFVVLDFDFSLASSRDRDQTIEMLRRLVPDGNLGEASVLYTTLCQLAHDAAQTAGSYTEESLRKELALKNIAVDPSAAVQPDLERLTDHSASVLNAIGNKIGGVNLERPSVITQALELVETSGCVVLTGPPGVGKSVVLRTVVETLLPTCPVVALDADAIGGVAGWLGFASRLAIKIPCRKSSQASAMHLTQFSRSTVLIASLNRGPNVRSSTF